MSSELIRAYKATKRIHMLLVLEFPGRTARFAFYQINTSGSSPHRFDAKIISISNIGPRFDTSTWSYSQPTVTVTLENSERFQDFETQARDGAGTGTIYLWAPGLSFNQAYPIFKGTFYKQSHDRRTYTFDLVDESGRALGKIPPYLITEDRFANRPTDNANQAVPLVYGNFPKGAPLVLVDEQNYKYVLTTGTAGSDEDDYNAGTYNVYDKDGNVIDPANYTVSTATDDQGTTHTIFTFNASYESYEPLTCSCQGITDTSGVVKMPADIALHILENYTNVDSSSIDYASFNAARGYLTSLSYAAAITDQDDGRPILDRLLRQVYCPYLLNGTRHGCLPFTTSKDAPIRGTIKDIDVLVSPPVFSRVGRDQLVNELTVKWGFNHGSRTYERTGVIDRTSNSLCSRSYTYHGNRTYKQTIELPDVWSDNVAYAIGAKHLSIYAFAHDAVTVNVSYDKGLNLNYGDHIACTLRDGSRGWTDERCVLVEKIYTKIGIRLTLWRVGI